MLLYCGKQSKFSKTILKNIKYVYRNYKLFSKEQALLIVLDYTIGCKKFSHNQIADIF